MKHNYFKHLFTALLLLCTTVAFAHDFEVDGICYNITDATKKTVEVTYQGRYYDSFSNEYTGNIEIPESVAYDGNTYSVASIGIYAFYGCKGLTSIEIPNSVISIEDGAFWGCTGLTSVEIPNSVTSIGSDAFYNCSGLTSIEIPNSVTSIGGCAFSSCSGLASIVVDGNNTKYDSREDCNAIIETETNTIIQGCKNTVIPNSVTSIGSYAFYGCSGLTSIEIPNSVTSIGGSAFCDCYGLGIIEIPSSVTSIGESTFYNCSRLTSIVIPNSVTSIGEDAFYGCSKLKTVINFSNLTFSKGSMDYGYIAYYADIYNESDVSIVDDFVFGKSNNVNTLLFYLGNATELILPADYKGEIYVIGAEVFTGKTTITSVVIPNNVTSIGASAFRGCTNIERLYIGNSIESIGYNAFAGCDKIKEIKIEQKKPIWGDISFFEKGVYDNAVLYVPAGTKSFYEKREPWNLFFYIVEMDLTGIDNVKGGPTVDASQSGTNGRRPEGLKANVKAFYDLNGRVVENPTKGIYIVDGKKVLVK